MLRCECGKAMNALHLCYWPPGGSWPAHHASLAKMFDDGTLPYVDTRRKQLRTGKGSTGYWRVEHPDIDLPAIPSDAPTDLSSD